MGDVLADERRNNNHSSAVASNVRLLNTRTRMQLWVLIVGSVIVSSLEGLLILCIVLRLSPAASIGAPSFLLRDFTSVVAGALIFLLLLVAIGRYLMTYYYTILGGSVRRQLLERTSTLINTTSLKTLEVNNGENGGTLSGQIGIISNFIAELQIFIPSVLSTILMVGTLLFISPFIALIFVIVFVPFAYTLQTRFNANSSREERLNQSRKEWSSNVDESLRAARELRLGPKLLHIIQMRFSTQTHIDACKERSEAKRLSTADSVGFTLLTGFALAIVLLAWEGAIDGAITGTAVLVIVLLISPLMTTAAMISQLGVMSSAATSIRKFIGVFELGITNKNDKSIRAIRSITFSELAPVFNATPTGWAQKGVSIDVPSGKIVFLTGPNGAGKTTLLKTIAGLYPAGKGIISAVDEQRRPTILSAENLRFLCAGVFAEGATPTPKEDEITTDLHASIVRVGLERHFFDNSSEENHAKLSFGEHRRLDLAYALSENKPIMCFDETGANQSPEFKKTFYCEILPSLAKQGVIIFVATHDEAFFDTADIRITLDKALTVAHKIESGSENIKFSRAHAI